MFKTLTWKQGARTTCQTRLSASSTLYSKTCPLLITSFKFSFSNFNGQLITEIEDINLIALKALVFDRVMFCKSERVPQRNKRFMIIQNRYSM